MAKTRFRNDMEITGDLEVGGTIALGAPASLPVYTVATAPDAGIAGRVIYVSDGDTGSPCLAVDDGSDWLRVALGAAIAAS